MNETRTADPATLLLAFLAGALTGAAVALLTAPQSGRETRDRLKGMARDAARATPRLNEAYVRAARAVGRALSEALDTDATTIAPPDGRTDH